MRATILFFFLAVAGIAPGWGQSRTVAAFAETAEGYNVFLYQSLIRVLNKDKNPDFNRLIQDLDHIRFVTTEAGTGDPAATFADLDRQVQAEGFVSLISYDNPTSRCHVYEMQARGGQSIWVATMYTSELAGVIEMKGSLNMKYLPALESLDIDRLEDILPEGLLPARPE